MVSGMPEQRETVNHILNYPIGYLSAIELFTDNLVKVVRDKVLVLYAVIYIMWPQLPKVAIIFFNSKKYFVWRVIVHIYRAIIYLNLAFYDFSPIISAQ